MFYFIRDLWRDLFLDFGFGVFKFLSQNVFAGHAPNFIYCTLFFYVDCLGDQYLKFVDLYVLNPNFLYFFSLYSSHYGSCKPM